MSILKSYNKNKKKHLLNEVTSTGGEGGVVSTGAIPSFTGRGGQEIDGIFSGGHHPDFGDLMGLLQQQLDDRFAKEDYSDKITLPYETAWDIVFKDYKFDDSTYLSGLENKKFKSTTGKDEEVDLDIKYDDNKILDLIDKDIFINNTNDWKAVSYSDIRNKWGAK
tara:strand:+ start:133 stop:627 length:495 start_codon:yes stop_codon:yes gene_type:complete